MNIEIVMNCVNYVGFRTLYTLTQESSDDTAIRPPHLWKSIAFINASYIKKKKKKKMISNEIIQ